MKFVSAQIFKYFPSLDTKNRRWTFLFITHRCVAVLKGLRIDIKLDYLSLSLSFLYWQLALLQPKLE